MATLVWDQVGERIFRAGVDHGVLYLHDGTVAVWNGITSVEQGDDKAELKSYYLDGVKYLQNLPPGDFKGKLKALTYPDEFNAVNGIIEAAPGLFYYDQPPLSFDLTYRVKIGDDVEGIDHAYEIHILYNVIANPEDVANNTIGDQAQATEFGWSLNGTPPSGFDKYRPTAHVVVHSEKTPAEVLKMLEDTLYGTDTTGPSLPPIHDIAEYFGYLGALLIIDNGDGSWTAVDESDGYITMLDATTFMIENANASYLDPVTYTISSTNVNIPI